MFGNALVEYGIIQPIVSAISVDPLTPYFVTSVVGLALYSTSQNLDEGSEIEDDPLSIETNWRDPVGMFKEAWKKVFRSVASMVYVGIVISVSALLSAYLTGLVFPASGVVIAAVGPAVEMELAKSQIWFFSPSALIAFPAFTLVIVASMPTALLLVVSEILVESSRILTRVVRKMTSLVVKLVDIPNADSATLDPFNRTFNRRQGR
jgi:hypothetical protein